MAGATERLRRKTTVSQKGCSELMMLTPEWWMQFLLPVGRYMPAVYVAAWKRVWRLLCKAWREVWDQGFRIKLLVREARVSDLCRAARWYDSRDSCSKAVYHRIVSMRNGRFCIVTMPWKTFVGLRVFLTCDACMEWLDGLHFFWDQREFAQPAFCLQREL